MEFNPGDEALLHKHFAESAARKLNFLFLKCARLKMMSRLNDYCAWKLKVEHVFFCFLTILALKNMSFQ